MQPVLHVPTIDHQFDHQTRETLAHMGTLCGITLAPWNSGGGAAARRALNRSRTPGLLLAAAATGAANNMRAEESIALAGAHATGVAAGMRSPGPRSARSRRAPSGRSSTANRLTTLRAPGALAACAMAASQRVSQDRRWPMQGLSRLVGARVESVTKGSPANLGVRGPRAG